MTLVTGTITDLTGAPDPTAWSFYTPLRESDDGDSVITMQHVRRTPVAGVLSVDLDPGFAIVSYRGLTYNVTVPASPIDIYDLLAAAIAFPAGTSAEDVAAAVTAYLTGNPINWSTLAGKPAVIAAGATQALARTAIGALSSAEISTLITAAVNALVNGAPGALDTLKELADALGNDANLAATIATLLGLKAPIASPTFTGTVGGITKAMVSLGNVDNTSDANKPVSTAQQVALDGKTANLVPTVVKTAAYTAAVNDLVVCDATTAFTVTLPTAPADKSRVAVKLVLPASPTTNQLITIASAGSDVFNKTGGVTALTLALQNQAVVLQYKASGAIWYVVSTDAPLSTTGRALVSSTSRDAARQVIAYPLTRTPQTVAVFTFDDTFTEDITLVQPILDAKSIKGGFLASEYYINPGSFSGHLTWTQVKGLQDAGHEIVAHSVGHIDLTALSEADVRTQVNNLSVYTSHGLIAPRGFGYPIGACNALVRRVVRDYYDYALVGAQPYASGSQQPLSTYTIRRLTIDDTTTLAAYTPAIDAAVTNKEIIIFILHSGLAGITATSFTNLSNIIDYIQSLSIPIMKPSEAFDLVRNQWDGGDYPGGTQYDVTDMTGKKHVPPPTALTGVSLTGPLIDVVKGVNANAVVTVTDVASAVNSLQIANGVTTTGVPTVKAIGTDTNVNLGLEAKGAAKIRLKAGSTSPVGVDTSAVTTTRTASFTDSDITFAGQGSFAQTFSGARINPRVSSTASASSLTPTIAAVGGFDMYCYTALAAGLTINAPTGTPVDGNRLRFRFKDDGTSRSLTWNAIFRAMGTTIPTATVISKTVYIDCTYNAAATKWDVISVNQEV